MEKKIAEFIGIMLGDGSIGLYDCKCGNKIKKHRVVKVTLDSRNKQYTEYVRDLMKKVLDIEPRLNYKKTENAVDIRTGRKDAFAYVTDKLGLKISPKWDKMEIPKKYMDDKLSCLVLRGLFDTDGCLTIFDNNGTIYPRIEIRLCPSPAQNQVSQILDNLAIKYKIQELERGKTKIRISGKNELEKWFKLIGSSNHIHFEKFKRFHKETFIS